MMKEKEIKQAVREGYARLAKQVNEYSSSGSNCFGVPDEICKMLGYTEEEIQAAPPGSNLGLGCGNPVAMASLKEGEIVLDMGSGAGFDCFIASMRVGLSGKVIGVDMTTEMVDRARANARKAGFANIDFRQGELENMPVADNYVDVVISNCVINLVPNKKLTFKEAYRVLRPGGRLAFTDLILLKDLPEFVKTSTGAYIGCLAGAIFKEEYIDLMRSAGFEELTVVSDCTFPIEILVSDCGGQAIVDIPELSSWQLRQIKSSISSIKVSAIKPH
jgi:arsenite methyltransferase